MLVMRQRVGQTILIGDDVQIEILEVGGNRVKLGVTAPKHIKVQRKEAELTRQENVAASQADLTPFLDRWKLNST